MREKTLGILLCISSALMYGMNAVLVKQLTLMGVTVSGIMVLRGLLALLLVGSWLRMRGVRIFPENRHTMCLLLVHGLGGAGLTMVLLNLSYLYLPAGMATTIHYLYPLLVNLCGFFFFRAALRPSTLAVLAAVVGGVALLAGSGGAVNGVGILLAGASSFSWAFHLMFLDHTSLRNQPPLRLTFWQAVCSGTLGMVLLPIKGDNLFQGISPLTLGLLLLSALCSLVVANLLLNMGVCRAGSALASIFNVFEPVGSIIFGLIFLGEVPAFRQWVGMAVILGGILFLLWRNSQTPAAVTD